jgi:hypothetical protein
MYSMSMRKLRSMHLMGCFLLPRIQRTRLGCHLLADFASSYGQNSSLHLVPYVAVPMIFTLMSLHLGFPLHVDFAHKQVHIGC